MFVVVEEVVVYGEFEVGGWVCLFVYGVYGVELGCVGLKGRMSVVVCVILVCCFYGWCCLF